MKKISVLVPCYNEEKNIAEMAAIIAKEFKDYLINYEYEIVFIDNCSTDSTRKIIEELTKNDKRIKAIFNARNFGFVNSPYYGLMQVTGDCAIQIAADFQEPPEMIHKFVEEWESGWKVVIGIKNKTHENLIIKGFRNLYYKLIRKFSKVEQIDHFTGFGLYDREFLDFLKKIDDSTPYLKGAVAEFGFKRKSLYYEQKKRKEGKTSTNFFILYDTAMLGFTSYTKFGLRLATFSGMVIAFFSFIIGFIYLILKLMYWNSFSAGAAPILVGTFFLGAIQLVFIGFLGEYIMAINERVKHRPLVIEEKRINF